MRCPLCGDKCESSYCRRCRVQTEQEITCSGCGRLIETCLPSCPACGLTSDGRTTSDGSPIDPFSFRVDTSPSPSSAVRVATPPQAPATINVGGDYAGGNIEKNITNIGQQFTGPVTIRSDDGQTDMDRFRDLLGRAKASLKSGLPHQSSALADEALRINPADPEANLVKGVALLSGGDIRRLSSRVAKRAESHLETALNNPSPATNTESNALYALGALRHCYYRQNSSREPSPSFGELAHRYRALCGIAVKPRDEILEGLGTTGSFECDWMLE